MIHHVALHKNKRTRFAGPHDVSISVTGLLGLWIKVPLHGLPFRALEPKENATNVALCAGIKYVLDIPCTSAGIIDTI